ncbi:20093_t:CDS:2, partial [Gigaspora margarita]
RKGIIVYEKLLQALDQDEQIKSLVYAYYLEEAASRIYRLFEQQGVEQLYCTNWTTLEKIYYLPQSEFEQLLH